MKNGLIHSEDDTFHTHKTENFKSNFYYESVALKVIAVKRKGSAKSVLGKVSGKGSATSFSYL